MATASVTRSASSARRQVVPQFVQVVGQRLGVATTRGNSEPARPWSSTCRNVPSRSPATTGVPAAIASVRIMPKDLHTGVRSDVGIANASQHPGACPIRTHHAQEGDPGRDVGRRGPRSPRRCRPDRPPARRRSGRRGASWVERLQQDGEAFAGGSVKRPRNPMARPDPASPQAARHRQEAGHRHARSRDHPGVTAEGVDLHFATHRR